MLDNPSKPSTAFEDHRLLMSGPLADVALAVKAAIEGGSSACFLVFDDLTGAVIDLDLRGDARDVVERLSHPPQLSTGRRSAGLSTPSEPALDDASEPRGRGRPKLGVVAREVTLLPRQWDWLASQPGGVSATLRRLVDDVRRSSLSREEKRSAQAAAYQFMTAIAGDMPGYEEGIRALFAGDEPKLAQCMDAWPHDIKSYTMRLAAGNPVSTST